MATRTLPGADIRGFYEQLRIQLPDNSRTNVSVRCFANPAAHRRDDRNPSCSVNIWSGAWKCHGCGADGGAYDAAWRKGYTPRAAIDLMIAHGLIERRARLRTARELLDEPGHAAATPPGPPARTRAREDLAAPPALQTTKRDIARWQTALSRRPALLARLASERGWCYQTMRALELGLNRGRITIPIRNAHGDLRGVLRYQPEHTPRPKMLADEGSRLGLVPHPATETSKRIVLVEGPPDMIAARSRDLPAIAVPGAHAWQPSWASLLAGRHVTIVMDADAQGRAAAERIAADLASHAHADIVDLAPLRDDGYDLTDWLLDNARVTHSELACPGEWSFAATGREEGQR